MWLAALTAAGEHDQMRRNSREWITRIPPSLRGRLNVWRAYVETNVEEQQGLLCAALDDFAGHHPLRAALAYAQASITVGYLLGRPDQARSLAAAAIPPARAAGYPPLLRGAVAADGLLAALAGDPGAGEQLREAVGLPGFTDSPFPFRSPETALGMRHVWRGETGQARDLLQAVMAQAERVGSRGCAFNTKIALVHLEWYAGNWDTAAVHAQAWIRWSRESSFGRSGPGAFAMSLVKAGYGDVEDARALAASGLREAEAQRDWAFAALSRWVLGQVELSVDDPAAALRWLDPVSDMLQTGGIGEPAPIRSPPT
jgi:hypothetical protein